MDKKVKIFVLYGDIMGEKYLNGMFVWWDWVKYYNGKLFIVYGYIFVVKVREIYNIINIDIGVVFGGVLMVF